MRITVLLDGMRPRTVDTGGRGLVIVGCRCPACGQPLEISVPRDDDDVACTACGVLVGRACRHAYAREDDEVRSAPRRARPRKWYREDY